MPAQSEMIIRGAVDDSANKLTYETDMLVEANETFLKKDKPLVVQAIKNVFVRVMNPSATNACTTIFLYHQVSSENYHDLKSLICYH
jgi:hypothetical protein